MSNAYRTKFNEVKVLEVLNRVNPKLWAKFGKKHKLDKVWMLKMVRNYELSLKEDLEEAEISIQQGYSDWEDYLKGAPRCSLDHGYQGYVNRTIVNKWS
jgi:hypothetical protein